MSTNAKNLIEQMQSYDPKTQQGLQKLILFINKLPQISQSFKVIKKLYLKYGLAIMIYLKPYYDKLNPRQQEIYDLKILAGIAQQMVSNKKITELQFIYKFGIIPYKKQVKKYDNQMYFINIVEQLSKLNSQFLSNSSQSQENIIKYKQKINQLQKQLFNNIQDKHQDNYDGQSKLLIKNTFIKFCLYFDQFGKKQIQNVQDCSEIMHQLSWGFISQTEQSLFGNFYDHQLNQAIQQKDRMLCCRKFFYKDQYLYHQEDLRTTFLQINYPFSELSLYTINRTICSMLNCQGGKIYIGIIKHQTGIKKIQTNLYTQNEKQQIFKGFRRAAQKISPQIFTKKLYYVQFIPICDQNQQFIPGANIIRITVSYGIRNEIYSYENDGFDYFTFRNNYDIIQKQGRNLLQTHRNIIIRPLPIPIPEHLEPCEKPEIGQPLHTKSFSNKPTKQTKYLSKQLAISDRLSHNLTDQTLQKQLKNKKNIYSVTNQGSRSQHNKENMGQNGSHYTQATKKQITQYTYFYVVGLDEKHLIPIFIEKKLIQNIKIQSNKQHRLVVRIHGVLQTSKARKILKKIQERYYNKNIKVYQMSQVLEIDKNNFNNAIKLINNIQLAYKIIDGNYIIFKLFRESLRAFIQLQSNKLPIRFILSKKQQLKKIAYSDISSKTCFFRNY